MMSGINMQEKYQVKQSKYVIDFAFHAQIFILQHLLYAGDSKQLTFNTFL